MRRGGFVAEIVSALVRVGLARGGEAMLQGYPKAIEIRGGIKVTLRPMVKEDVEKLWAFFQGMPREDRLFLRDDVSKRETIEAWAKDLDYEKVLPIVAEWDGRIVADATLHRRRFGWTRHVGKIRLVVAKEFREKGLGSALVQEIIQIAKAAKLELLVAEIMETEGAALRAFKHLGFEREAIFYNYVRDQVDRPHSLVVTIKDLTVPAAPPVMF